MPPFPIDLSLETRLAEGNVESPLMGESSVTACGEVVSGAPLRPFPPPTHRRLLLDTPLRPLGAFGSSWELVNAIKDALIVHRNVFRGNGVLHGDISASNILLGPKGGVLIGWDLSSPRTGLNAGTPERKDTVQFVACRILDWELGDPTLPRELRDDIESFVHVLLWTVCRHARGEAQSQARVALLQAYDGGSGVAKTAMATFPALDRKLKIGTPQLAAIVKDCVRALRARFNADEGDVDDETEANKLLSHDWLIGRLEEALKDEGWRNLGDAAVRYVPYVAEAPLWRKRQ